MLTKKSQDERPVYCRKCYVPMKDLARSDDTYHWRCDECGLEWKPKPVYPAENLE
jgi:hypothetical protein